MNRLIALCLLIGLVGCDQQKPQEVLDQHLPTDAKNVRIVKYNSINQAQWVEFDYKGKRYLCSVAREGGMVEIGQGESK